LERKFTRHRVLFLSFTLVMTLTLGVTLKNIYQSIPDFKKIGFSQLKKITKNSIMRKLDNPIQFQNYHWVELKDIHGEFLSSIVMSEDSTFFEHDGIDVHAILDAMKKNIRKRKYAFGASTISQQVVKNVFLTKEKSIIRKIKEWIITQELELHFDKDEILEVYLNLVEVGPNLFGVHAAAKIYFNKRPSEINAAEGAFIAQMLPSPRKNYYSVFLKQKIPPLHRRRISRILDDMLKMKLITDEEFQRYIQYPYFNREIPTHGS
jgi:monofunctional biosynthetic peptidoglycan transglycosylase